MYGSPATSRDLNLTIPVSPFKHGKEDSDLVHHHQQQQQQQQHMSIGLLRYRSAPSSLLGEMCEDFLPQRSSGADTETLFTRLVSGDDKPSAAAAAGGAVAAGERSPRYVPEDGGLSSSAASQMVYQEQQQPQQQLSAHGSAAPAVVEGPYRVTRSMAIDGEQEKGGVNGANLVRHSSSPAGLFAHLSVENGYAVMSGMSGLKGQMSFLSRQSSSSGLMTQISEIGGESIGGIGPEDVGMGNGMGSGRCFIPGFPVASWDDPSLLSDGLSGGLKRARNPSEAQIGDVRCHVPSLTHHFSLPKTSSEMAAVFQFQDAVPCKIRAKRGCATHPRSIAERVRRTKISERMRRLQELVPNMDKQTNTADMLDLAVEYIKDLEKQVKVLSESRANCTCSSTQNP